MSVVPADIPVDWPSLTTREWFSPCMAADWVRLAFLAPASSLDVCSTSTHSSGEARVDILDVIPTFRDLSLLLIQHRPGRGVNRPESLFADILASSYVAPKMVSPSVFWPFVARFLLSFQVPRKTPHGTIVFTDKRGFLRATSSKMGLGVSPGFHTSKGKPVKGLWGSLFALSSADIAFFQQVGGASTHSIVKGETSAQHLLLGPLALVNSRCALHANCLPDKDSTPRPSDPVTGLSSTDWTMAYSTRALGPGQELFLPYGTEYEDPDDPTFRTICERCPITYRNANADDSSEWLDQDSKTVSTSLAEDWVAAAILRHVAIGSWDGVPHKLRSEYTPPSFEEIVTHSVGTARTALLETVPDWDELLPILTSCSRSPQLKNMLADLYSGRLRQSFGSCFSSTTFWHHVVRWARSLGFLRQTAGCVGVTWVPGRGFCMSSAQTHRPFSVDKVTSGNEACTPLWGSYVEVPRRKQDYVLRMDNLSSRNLLRGNEILHILFGPLARCAHGCEAHANIGPDAQPGGSASVSARSNLTTSDYHGGYALGHIFHRDIFLYQFSQSSRANDDSFSTCLACERLLETSAELASSEAGATPSAEVTPTTLLERELPPNAVPRSCSDQQAALQKAAADKKASLLPGKDKWGGHRLTRTGCHGHTRMFRYGTVNSNLSVNLLDTNLGMIMRAMHGFDISVMGISETNAKPGSVLTDSKGIAERGIAGLKYMSLWAFMPKGRATGGGTSLVWDARIPHRNAYTSPSGRMAAITLCGPKQSHLRVISVYAPANPEAEPDVVRQLYKDLLNQMSFARRNSVPVMVLGDFNDVPEGDLAFAKRDKVYPKKYSLLKYLSNKLLDTYRVGDPHHHGHSHWRKNEVPSRIDSIHCPSGWLSSLMSPEAEASVDYTCANFPSNHYPVLGAVSFHTVFRSSSRAVRVQARRTYLGKLDLRPLRNAEELSAFQDHLVNSDKALELKTSVESHWVCTCGPPPDEPPAVVMGVAKEGGPQYTGPAVVKVGGVKPPSYRCLCAPPRPVDAEEVLSKLMDEWTDIPLKQLPVRLQRRPKQKGYKPTAAGAPLLFQKASTLRNLLKHGPPPAKDLGDAVASLGELLILADEEQVPLGFDRDALVAPSSAHSDIWAAQASNACGQSSITLGTSWPITRARILA